MKLKEMLREYLSEEELKHAPSTFDIIGSREKAVAIVEIDPILEDKKYLIAESIMKIHKNVKTVLRKLSERKTMYRIREYEILTGEEDTEVIHKEHGIRLKLDPRKVYFSPREATERLRVAKQVKPGEVVMVMFAGVGPYAFMITKVQPLVKKVIAIELNPYAYQYLVENVKLNKVENKVIPVLGDVRVMAKKWYGECDRVVMPLPKGAYRFLDEAFQCIKGEGVIHFYFWAREESLFNNAIEHIWGYAWKYKCSVKILDARKVLPYAPGVYKICVDFRVKNIY
ncbi:MAG: class I SAM-dependent methyltransferase family protein [Thermoprotei archaeon]|nr:MAG: class I SAM-dependent methyltransferase family protein [Thermoprotei archaeon]